MSGFGGLFSVLMVGHSLFGQDGPDMLQEALRAGQGQGVVQAQIINGAPLAYNWEHSTDAEGIDARAVLPEGKTTHLILTEALPLANHTRWSDSEVYAQAFFGLAAAANPEVKVYLQETWHSLKSGTGVMVEYDDGADMPWRDRLAADLGTWEGIVEAVARGRTSDEASVELIPAGQAMARLSDEIAAGRVDGMAGIEALFADDIHLNDTGHYFVSMVQYATLTGQDPQGLPTDFSDRWGNAFDTPEPDLARQLQRVAWEAVKAYRRAKVTAVPAPAPIKVSASEQMAPVAPNAPPAADRPPAAPGNPPPPARAEAMEPVEERAAAPATIAEPGAKTLGMNLAPIADWSTQVPFIDLMKTARPWLGHVAGRFGGMEYAELAAAGALDAEGWPQRLPRKLGSIGTLVLTDMPEAAKVLMGRYVLRYEGRGTIEVTGRATNVRYGSNEVRFDYSPGPGSVDIRIQRINSSDPPRNVTVMREEHVAAYDTGAIFNPDLMAHLRGVKLLRFMDWTMTNDSPIAIWEDRPRVSDVTYALRGVPLPVMLALANELQADPWFNMPHLADDTYMRNFAEAVKSALDPALTAHVEFSNEVWNWQFAQTRWADEQAEARWGEAEKGMQFYGMRAAEMARVWGEVFGAEAKTRLTRVISSQTGWLGLETEALEAPLFVAEDPQNSAPVAAFDAYAVTGYFGGVLGLADRAEMVSGWLAESGEAARAAGAAEGLEGDALDAYVEAHRFNRASELAAQELRDGSVSGRKADTLADLVGRVWPHHAAVARAHDLDLLTYEGGSHVVGLGERVDDGELTAFFHHLNYTPEMGALYAALLAGWQAVGGQAFVHYADVYAPTKWGSWGALRHLGDDNPRWQALQAWK